ncbi:MAG: hypothetical protein IJK64_00835 [Clostridia bacterium]|nr:hypothetical protein [Clostridia bacterium]
MSDFRWLFDAALAAHVRTPLLILTIVVLLIIAVTAVLVAQTLKKQRLISAAQAQEETPQATEDAPC